MGQWHERHGSHSQYSVPGGRSVSAPPTAPGPAVSPLGHELSLSVPRRARAREGSGAR